MRRPFAALATLALLTAALPAAAQQPPAESKQDTPDIVVTGQLDPDELPTQVKIAPVLDRSMSRGLASDSDRFVRCTGLPKPGELRKILDHGARNPAAQKALHRYIARSQGCYIGYFPPVPASPFYGDCNPQGNMRDGGRRGEGGLCRVFYDRGTLFERAIKAYAAPLALTRMQTFDPKIRARYMQRETTRDIDRQPLDRLYADTVGCFVQIAPEYARRLLAAERGSPQEDYARRVLIGLGAPCVGGAKDVKADPTQFRAYTAEAVYEWLVAVKGEGTLVEG